MGDTLIEFNSAGEAHQIWSVFDDLDPTVIPSTATPPDPGTGTWDWSHANYLTWVPESQELLVSFRELDAIVAVDLDRGALTWSLSNDWGTYRPPEGEIALQWPHCVEPFEGGLAVFNQAYGWEDGACSWGAVLTLDDDAATATAAWRYQDEACTHLFYLGSIQPLPNGDQQLTFSQAGKIEEVTPEGEVVRSFTAAFGWIFGYAWTTTELRPVAN